jgi:hypothetical protein
MKYFRWLLCMLLSAGLQAQVAKLESLSKGKFYSSAAIKDGSNSVKGYFLLYESDKVAKETYQLEYILLDENLDRVTSGFITEDKYEGFSFKVMSINVEASLCRNKLLLEFSDNFETTLAYKRYRILDITTFEMSEPFMAKDGKLVFNPVFDKNLRDDYDKQSDSVMFFKDVGLVTFSPYVTKKSADREKYITHFDDNFNPVWKYVFDLAEGKGKSVDQKSAFYIQSNANLIVLLTDGVRSGGKFMKGLAVHFLDAKTGKLIKEQASPEGSTFAYEVDECLITDDKIVLTGLYREGEQWGNIVSYMNEGMFRHVYDRATLEILDAKKLGWKELLNGEYTLDKRSLIDGEGSMFLHDVRPLSNGGMVAVCEVYGIPILTFDIFFLEFNPDFTLKQIFVAKKFRTKFSGWIYNTADFVKYGIFDYVDYQDLDDDEIVFLFLDNEKAGTDRKFTNRFGIVSYSEGKFVRQTLELESPGSSRNIINAKKGYMLVQENFNDKNKKDEMRLETINY